MTQLVRLITRPSRNGERYTFCVEYKNENGKRVRQSLRHADKRKAEQQRAQLERDLRMGTVAPGSLKLKEFLEDSLGRTRGNVRDSSLKAYEDCFQDFIRFAGNVDYRSITLRHGEQYIQACLDRGNRPATAGKKVRHLKRLFQLAVERGQLEENPFRFLKSLKSPVKIIRVLSEEECHRLLDTASKYEAHNTVNWLLVLKLTLCTGMRKGEVLNLTWMDVDFEAKTVNVSPKSNTAYTWLWHIKDSDHRVLPITDDVVDMLSLHQSERSAGNPYLFVPEPRYHFIQGLRQQGQWDVIKGKNPLSNFDRQYKTILRKAGITNFTFHDLRRTCLTHWFKGGLREFDVMRMAGHSSFETTRKFYMGVDRDLLERTRQANNKTLSAMFGTHLARAPKNP
jgi:integrase